jgi:hypothetical protein
MPRNVGQAGPVAQRVEQQTDGQDRFAGTASPTPSSRRGGPVAEDRGRFRRWEPQPGLILKFEVVHHGVGPSAQLIEKHRLAAFNRRRSVIGISD